MFSKSSARFWGSVFVALVVVACLYYSRTLGLDTPLHLFEDGSFIVGSVHGCLPWAICAIP